MPKFKSYADIECPYCGADQNISHDDGYGCEEDEIHQQECSECEKYFAYSTTIIFSYTAWQAACMNEGDHDFRKTNTYPEEFAELKCKLCGEHKPIEAETSQPDTGSEFELQSCETCLQLTNHLNGICQKCKK